MTPICDNCVDAVQDEYPEPLTPETINIIARTMGQGMPDHCCDAVEEPGAECDCACREGYPASAGQPQHPAG